jgi:Lrp/AsnC family transcriptional regulator for asnA, asnC and gidA
MKKDDIRQKVVEFLVEDGTLSNSEIARRLNISEATVRRWRAWLVENDVIRFAAVSNPFKLGYKVMAIVGIQVIKEKLINVEKSLVALPEVRFVGVVVGSVDLILEAWFKTNDDFLHFLTITLASIEGIQRTESYQVLRLSKYTYDWGKYSK